MVFKLGDVGLSLQSAVLVVWLLLVFAIYLDHEWKGGKCQHTPVIPTLGGGLQVQD